MGFMTMFHASGSRELRPVNPPVAVYDEFVAQVPTTLCLKEKAWSMSGVSGWEGRGRGWRGGGSGGGGGVVGVGWERWGSWENAIERGRAGAKRMAWASPRDVREWEWMEKLGEGQGRLYDGQARPG
jgi:hypothetical protein